MSKKLKILMDTVVHY